VSWVVSSDQFTSQPYKNRGASLTINAGLPGATLTSISAYTHSSFGPLNYDADTTENTVVHVGVASQPWLGLFQDSRTWSQEIYLSNTVDRFDWLVGAVYLDEDAKYGGADEFGPGNLFFFPATSQTKAYAAYGQLGYQLTPRLKVSAGLRYSDETKDVGRAIGSPTPAPLQFDEASWDAWTPSFTATYRFNEGNMVYANFSKGFKSGGFNSADFGPLGPPLDPEEIRSYELGMKSEWLDRRLRMDLSVFKYKFTDLQVHTFEPPFSVVWENAGEAEGKGVELSLRALIGEGFTLDGGVSLVDAEYTRFESLVGSAPVSFAGNRPPHSPTSTFSLGAAYTADLSDRTRAAFRLDYYHSSRRFFTSANEPELSQSAYGLLNGRISFEFTQSGAWVSAFAKNLTDELVYASGFQLGPTVVMAPTAPRTYGVEVGIDF
jgi:iron complex outermembrane receptor protein